MGHGTSGAACAARLVRRQTQRLAAWGRSGVAAARLALACGAGGVVVFDTGDPERSEAAACGFILGLGGCCRKCLCFCMGCT